MSTTNPVRSDVKMADVTTAVVAETDDLVRQFAERGHAGPVHVLPVRECRQFLRAAQLEREPPWDWFKGRGASSRVFYDLSVHPAILRVVTGLLGEDVMLWGASLLVRRPGAVHPWHSDIETADLRGRTVTVWVGLEHTRRDSSLTLIPYSHRFGTSVQEVRHQQGKGRGDTTNEDVLGWARDRDPRSEVVTRGISDGEALFFDGRIWHSSNNAFSRTRRALLLQYATPDAEIRIPDLNRLDWPFQYLASPKPPCIMVRGSDRFGVNLIVAEPAARDRTSNRPLASRVYPLQLPLPPDEAKAWTPYPIFRGRTASIQDLACHISVLNPHRIPHPPHRHEEEEILLLLAGEVDLILPDLTTHDASERTRLRAGEFVYYPARFTHTLETTSAQPANYLMFKWKNRFGSVDTKPALSFGRFTLRASETSPGETPGYRPQRVFEGATTWLRKLHCHVSTLAPGAGYDPHVDRYDVAIIALEGEFETIGERVKPHGVVFYPAGARHGMRNPGRATAKYVVFEFHGAQSVLDRPSLFLRRWLPTRFTSGRYWKKKVGRLLLRRERRGNT